MAKVWKDRVAETTATTGTGTITGSGALTQYQSFSAIGTGNTCDYCILSGNGTDWETGEGTVTLTGSPAVRTLSRDTIYDSSNGGAAISLSGTSTVFCTVTARRASDPATSQSAGADVTGTTSTTGVMAGLAGSFTPSRSGKAVLFATGSMSNGTASRGTVVSIYYGTGGAPSNGAALTGTDTAHGAFHNTAAAALTVPFAAIAIVTAFVAGTTYWLDLSYRSITGGTSSLWGVSIGAYEIAP